MDINRDRIKCLVERGKIRASFNDEEIGTLCICAIRYCHGRQTYMPSLVCDIVLRLVPMLSDKDLGVMIEDCAFQRRYHLYGDEKIDMPGWLKWEQYLLEEKERRTRKGKENG